MRKYVCLTESIFSKISPTEAKSLYLKLQGEANGETVVNPIFSLRKATTQSPKCHF